MKCISQCGMLRNEDYILIERYIVRYKEKYRILLRNKDIFKLRIKNLFYLKYHFYCYQFNEMNFIMWNMKFLINIKLYAEGG
ncbi:hypothetical protein SH2C18_42610 [Clostridium sediminicola]